MIRKNFYLSEFKKTLPIIINSQCLKGKNSGCFHEGFLNNTEPINPIWQEAVLSLRYFYGMGIKGVLPRIENGIRFWCKTQNEDGSFPLLWNKRSYPCTAFSTFAIARTFNDMNDKLKGIEDLLIPTLDMACKYIKNHSQLDLSNQEAIAGLTLIECSKLIGKYRKYGIMKIKSVIKNQNDDGFYPEFGGPDIGYNSLTLEILGHAWLTLKKRYILESIEKCLEWLQYFIFPDGSVGGCYNSRKPGWLILDGFEIFKEEFPVCETIIKKHIRGHIAGLFDCTHLIDKRHIMTDGYRLFFAYQNSQNKIRKKHHKLPYENKIMRKKFESSKLYIIKRPEFMLILSLSDISGNGITVWTKDWMIMDLDNSSPNLVDIDSEIGENYFMISGYPSLYKRILRKLNMMRTWEVMKTIIPRYKILYKFDKTLYIRSNKPIEVPFLGLRCGKKKSNKSNSIFFKRHDYYVKEVSEEGLSVPFSRK